MGSGSLRAWPCPQPFSRAPWEMWARECGLPCVWGSQGAELPGQSTCSLSEFMKMLAVCFLPAVTAATAPSGSAGGVMVSVSGLPWGGGGAVFSSCGFQFYSSELKPQLLDGFKKSNDFVDYLAFSSFSFSCVFIS